MNARTVLLLAVLLPGMLSAQSRATLSTYISADATLAGMPVLVGASLAKESGGLGARLGVAVDARERAPEQGTTWSTDVDGTLSPGALVPALRDWRLFAGVGAHREGYEAGAGPVVLSTSLGAGYRHALLSHLAVEGEVRYRVPLPEHRDPGLELRVGLSLHTGAPRARLPEAPASRPAPAAPVSVPAPAAVARRAIDTGHGLLGVRYTWGGNTPEEGFDCSGFLRYVFVRHGITLPRVSRDQARAGEPLPLDVAALRPGDLMFFATRGAEVDHAAMYVGDGRILHSSASGGGVRYDDLSSRRGQYYLSHLVAARRVVSEATLPFSPYGR